MTTTKRPRPARSLLRRHDYRMLLLSFGTSRTGDLLYLVALVVYVYGQTQSAAWVAAATLARFVPYVLLSPLAGVVADRYPRRSVMLASDLVQLAVMVGMTVAAALAAPALLVIALSVLGACAATLYQACASSMLQHAVPEDELATANSVLSTVDTLTFTVGPALGALLLLFGEPAVAFGVNAATFAVSTAAVLAIRTRARPTGRTERPHLGRELRDGLAVLAGNRTLAVLVATIVAGTMVYGAELVVLVLISTELLGTGEPGLGWLLGASGIGGLLGAALAARFARSGRPRLTLIVLVLLTGLPLAVLAFVRDPALAYAVLLVEGAAIVVIDVLIETALQRGVDPDVMGRVSGIVVSLASAGTAVGTLLAPVLVGVLGLPAALVVLGAGPVVVAAIALVLLPGFDADAGRSRAALAPRVELLAGLRLLDGAGIPALERLAAAATEERVPPGRVVLREGDPADDLFVLVDGSLAVEHAATGPLPALTAPDYLGEIGLLRRTPRTATVTATTDAVLWRIPGALFLDAVTAGGPSSVLTAGMRTRLARTPV